MRGVSSVTRQNDRVAVDVNEAVARLEASGLPVPDFNFHAALTRPVAKVSVVIQGAGILRLHRKYK